jgi:3-methyladenine DNA glycosylase Mpg
MDYRAFFNRKSDVVAKDLLGRYLVKTTPSGLTRCERLCELTEVGAYKGDLDLPSRAGMSYAPGELFLMPYRGTLLFNIATGKEGDPACVEIRAAKFGEKETKGSGRIAHMFGLTEKLDGKDFEKVFRLSGDPVARKNISFSHGRGMSENCTGYFSLK